MKLYQFGVVLLEDLCNEDAVREVPAEVTFWPAEGEPVDPLEELLHLVLIYRWCLH